MLGLLVMIMSRMVLIELLTVSIFNQNIVEQVGNVSQSVSMIMAGDIGIAILTELVHLCK